MAPPEPPHDRKALEGAMRAAFGAPPSSVLDAIERLTGTRSSVLLRDAPEEASPVALSPAREPAADDSRYQVLGEIARGGIGVVYKGRDKDLNREVALKVLRPEYAESPEVLRRFVEEAQIGGQLQHPGLVPVYGMGLQPDGRPYFAMRLIKGETLAALLPRTDRARLVAIFEQVAQTVAYAHSRGVVHRDLKPSNVMVGAFGEVQVVDWGFAKVLGRGEEGPRGGETVVATVRTADEGSGSLAGSVMGTPAYMPPEQALGHVDALDERTDVFALGAILCEILTLEPVYGGGRSDQILQAAQARVDDALRRIAASDAHDDLRSLARDCLAPLPKDRPANAGVVAQRVHDHLASVEERARAAEIEAVEAEARAERERHRRRRTIVVAAATLLAVAIGGGAFLWREADARARAEAAAPRVASAMREATAHQGAGAWPAAVAAAQRALDLAETAGADPELLASARDLAERVRAEEALAEAEARHRAEENALLATLDEACAPWTLEAEVQAMDAACLAALANVGIDPADPDSAARLRASPVAGRIAASLDAWAVMRRRTGRDWKTLDLLARAIDPLDANDALRDAWATNDLAALREAAARADIESLPPETLASLAWALRAAGDRDSCVALARRARDLHPASWRVHLAVWGTLRDTEEGARAAAAVVALRPRSPSARNNLGDALLSQGDRHGAIECFRASVRLDPSFAAGHFNLGNMLKEDGDRAGAIAAYREALRLWPDFTEARTNLAACLGEAKETEAAISMFREALRRRPDSVNGHLGLGAVFYGIGRFDEAVAECREAVRLAPHLAMAHDNLGSALMKRGDLDGAIAAYRESVRLDPGHALSRKNLANVLARSGARAEALTELREAIRIEPGLAPAHIELAHQLYMVGDIDGAAAAAREGIRLDPNNAEGHGILGLTLHRKRDLDAAIAACREAIRLKPGYPEAFNTLGMALAARKDVDGAIAAYREAIRLKPTYDEALNNLGNALARKGDIDGSIAAYREAIRVRPDYALAYRHLGLRLRVKGDVPGALSAWREAIRIDPNLAPAHSDLAAMLLDMGDLDGAIAAATEAIRLDPSSPEDYLNLGSALCRQGRFREALPHLKQGHEVGKRHPGRDSPSQASIDSCARNAELEERLPAVLDGTAKPADAGERAAMAQICYRQKRYAESARLFMDAIAEAHATAADPRNGLRYNAACSAALTGSADWRARALEWLRADLSALAPRADRGPILDHWTKDTDLAGVRDRIDGLPEAEREAWRKLWADVEALRRGK